MKTELKLYELFSPTQNLSIQAKLGSAILHPLPGMLAVDVSRVFQDAELMMKKEVQRVSNKEEVIGFRSAFAMLIACAYKNKGPMFEGLVMNNLAECGDEKVSEIGKAFLDQGAALLQRDPTGRSAMLEGVNHFKAKFPNDDFCRGLDVALIVYEESLSFLQ